MNHKELIERLRTSPAFDNTTLGNEAADAIEDLQEILLNVENAHAVVADAYGNILRERDTLRQKLAEAQARTEDVMKELLWMRQWMRKDEVNDGVVVSNAVGYQWSKWIDRVDAIKEAMKGAA